jgi:tol-pal system protein YbgF
MDFLNKYPGSSLAPTAYYRMSGAYYGLKDYKNAVNSYLTAASKYPSSGMAPNSLLGAAICYQEMGDKENAKKTLKQLIMNYPDNPITPRAKKRLDSLK